jgi:hypothetical protein
MGAIYTKVTVRTLGAQSGNADFVETVEQISTLLSIK